MRVDIRPSGFASDRLVCYGSDERGECLTVDVRDVDEREGTMRVDVLAVRVDALDVAAGGGEVLVQLPPERVPRGPRVWAARALVLEMHTAHLPTAPAAVDTKGDRGGIGPGDALPEEEVPPSPAPLSSAPDAAAEKARLRAEAEAAADERDRERAATDDGDRALLERFDPRGRVVRGRTMAVTVVDGLILVAHGTAPPAADEWADYVQLVAQQGIVGARQLIATEGGGPTRAQRGALDPQLGGQTMPTAVLSASLRVRVIAALLSFDGSVRGFPPSNAGLHDALSFLWVPTIRLPLIARELDKLRDEIDAGDPSLPSRLSPRLAWVLLAFVVLVIGGGGWALVRMADRATIKGEGPARVR